MDDGLAGAIQALAGLMAAGVLSQVNLHGKIVTADALHTVTATAEFICGQGPPGQGEHAVPTTDAAGGQAAERLHLAGGGAQQPCRQASGRNGQCGCQGDDREVDQR
jgi:hypothetical protein